MSECTHNCSTCSSNCSDRTEPQSLLKKLHEAKVDTPAKAPAKKKEAEL